MFESKIGVYVLHYIVVLDAKVGKAEPEDEEGPVVLLLLVDAWIVTIITFLMENQTHSRHLLKL